MPQNESTTTNPVSTLVQTEEDRQVAEFMKTQANAEKERLKQNGAEVNILKVKNTAVVREGPPTRKVINRIEANSDIDFDSIMQILVSPAVPCTPKPSLNYVNLILLSESEALLCPYTFIASDSDNNLQHWAFINNQLKRTEISINAFTDV